MSQIHDTTTTLLKLAESLTPDESREVLLDRVAAQVVLLLPAAAAVTITLVDSGQAATVTATDDTFVVLDEVQYTAGDGPCLEAARTHTLVRADIFLARRLWPVFAQTATDVGILTMLSCPLFLPADGVDAHRRATGERLAGAVNIWSFKPDAFDLVEAALIAIFTTAVSAVILTASRWARAQAEAEQLLSALDTRDTIATAKGIVMARHHHTPEDAFAWLTDVSQRTNRKIRDLADLIVADPDLIGTAP
jgi:hypothetical protein